MARGAGTGPLALGLSPLRSASISSGKAGLSSFDALDPRTDLRPGTVSGNPRIEFGPGALPAGATIKRGDLLRHQSTGIIRRVASVFVTKAEVTRCEVNLVGVG